MERQIIEHLTQYGIFISNVNASLEDIADELILSYPTTIYNGTVYYKEVFTFREFMYTFVYMNLLYSVKLSVDDVFRFLLLCLPPDLDDFMRIEKKFRW